MTLKKSDILNGINEVKYEYFEEFGDSIAMRPLSCAELCKIENLQCAGIKVKQKVGADRKVYTETEVDAQKINDNKFEGDCLAVSLSLSVEGEKWTIDDVKKMPAGLLEKIVDKVYEISGKKPEAAEEVTRFRGDTRS